MTQARSAANLIRKCCSAGLMAHLYHLTSRPRNPQPTNMLHTVWYIQLWRRDKSLLAVQLDLCAQAGPGGWTDDLARDKFRRVVLRRHVGQADSKSWWHSTGSGRIAPMQSGKHRSQFAAWNTGIMPPPPPKRSSSPDCPGYHLQLSIDTIVAVIFRLPGCIVISHTGPMSRLEDYSLTTHKYTLQSPLLLAVPVLRLVAIFQRSQ